MEYRTLNRTDLKVSRVSFGTMTFGSQVNEADAQRIVDRCFDAGVNFFDTANVYNSGRAEEMLGKALGARRAQVIVATKVRGKMGEAPDEQGLSGAAIQRAIDESLRRLGTDYIDVYYLHQPDYGVPIDETLAAVDRLVRDGKVRYPAVSNYAAWQVADIRCICARAGYRPPYISQPMYNLLARGIEEEYVPFCKQFGVAIVPYNPLAGGLLTGKYKTRQQPLAGGRFDGNQMYQDRYWHEDYFAAVEELDTVAREAGKTLVGLALEWLLAQPYVDSIILGASRYEQLEENLRACEAPRLSEQTLAACDAVWRRLRGITPKYNR
ncbi:MAG: aldo/keto reductase [Terriglobia bacterium]